MPRPAKNTVRSRPAKLPDCPVQVIGAMLMR